MVAEKMRHLIDEVESGVTPSTRAHPLMNKLLNKTDYEPLHQAYGRGVYGRNDLD